MAPRRQTDHRSARNRARLRAREMALGGRAYLGVAAQLPAPAHPLGTRPGRAYGLPHLRLRAYLPAIPYKLSQNSQDRLSSLVIPTERGVSDVRKLNPGEAASHHLASTRRVVGNHRTDSRLTRSAEEHRSAPRGPASRPGCDHLPDEKRLPVEPTAQRVPRRLFRASYLPEVDREGSAG